MESLLEVAWRRQKTSTVDTWSVSSRTATAGINDTEIPECLRVSTMRVLPVTLAKSSKSTDVSSEKLPNVLQVVIEIRLSVFNRYLSWCRTAKPIYPIPCSVD